MDITVREAQWEDSSAIVQLILELAESAGERSSLTQAYVAKYLSSKTNTILLAEIQGRVVGLLSYSLRPDLYHAADSCLIEELVVQETMRRQGIGSRLLTELLSRLGCSTNCAEVSVTTLPDNAEAIKFYRRHGLTDEAVFLERHFNL
jgi:ribosomal protein S18 acetylase RimI-like enzyme